VTDYLCAKFDDFSFSRFGFIMRTESQTDGIRGRSMLYSAQVTTSYVNNDAAQNCIASNLVQVMPSHALHPH